MGSVPIRSVTEWVGDTAEGGERAIKSKKEKRKVRRFGSINRLLPTVPSLSQLPRRAAPDGGVVSLARDPKADVSHSCDVGGRETARLRNHIQRVGAERMEKERWDERMFYCDCIM